MQSINIRFFSHFSIHCAAVNLACANTYACLPSLPASITLHFFSTKNITKNGVSLTNYIADTKLEMSVWYQLATLWYSNVSLWGSNKRRESAGDAENTTSREMHVLRLSVRHFQFPISTLQKCRPDSSPNAGDEPFGLNNLWNMRLRFSWAFELWV